MCPSLAEPDSGDFPRRKLPFIGRQRSDSADPHAVVFLEIGFMKITFSSIHKTHTGTTLSVCVFLFAIFLKNYLTNRKTYAIIKVLCEFFTVRGVTQLGRVLALGARCRRFEPVASTISFQASCRIHRQDVFLCCNSLTKITLSFLFSAALQENFF